MLLKLLLQFRVAFAIYCLLSWVKFFFHMDVLRNLDPSDMQ